MLIFIYENEENIFIIDKNYRKSPNLIILKHLAPHRVQQPNVTEVYLHYNYRCKIKEIIFSHQRCENVTKKNMNTVTSSLCFGEVVMCTTDK